MHPQVVESGPAQVFSLRENVHRLILLLSPLQAIERDAQLALDLPESEVDGVHDLVDVGSSNRKRWRDGNDVAANGKNQPAFAELGRQTVVQRHVGTETGLRGTVAHQLDATEQSQPSNVADDGMVARESRERLQEVLAGRGGVFHQLLRLDDLDALERNGGRDRMPREGEDVPEVGVRAREAVGNRGGGRDRANRHVSAAQSARHRHDIRLDAPMVDPEHLARPAQTRRHLVGDQHDTVLVAYLAEHRPVVGARHHPVVRHRFRDQRRDRTWLVELDELLDGLRASHRALRRCEVAHTATVHVRLRRIQHPRVRRFVVCRAMVESRAEPLDEAQVPVIGAEPADDLVAARFAVAPVVGPGDLDCRLVGLAAAAHGERAIQRARRDFRELASEVDR